MGKLCSFLLVFALLVVFTLCDEDNYDAQSQNYRSSDDYGNYDYNSNNKKGDDYDQDYQDYDYPDQQDYGNNDDEKYDDNEDNKRYMSSTADNTEPICTYDVKFIRHPTDCNKFYQCASGKPFLITCPGGLHFNKDLDICDWPSNVDCKNEGDDDDDENDDDNGSSEEYDNDYSDTASKGTDYVRSVPARINSVYYPPTYHQTGQYVPSNQPTYVQQSNKGVYPVQSKGVVISQGTKGYYPVQRQSKGVVISQGKGYYQPVQNKGMYNTVQNRGYNPVQSKGVYPAQNKGYYPAQNKGYYPAQNKGVYQVQNRGSYITKGVYQTQNKGTSIPVQSKGVVQPQTVYPQPNQPQFVTHYHYEYQPQPQQPMQRQQPQPRQQVVVERKPKRRTFVRPQQSRNQMGMNNPMMSAFSNMLMTMSSMRPSWYKPQMAPIMPYPQQPQVYQQPQTYQQPQQMMHYQPLIPQQKQVVVRQQQPMVQRPVMRQPMVERRVVHQPMVQQQQFVPRPVMQQQQQPMVYETVVQQPVMRRHQPRIVHRQPIQPRIIIQRPVQHQSHVQPIIKGQVSLKGDYYDNFDTSGAKGDVIYYDYDNVKAGGNVLEEFVDNSLYSKEKFEGGALYNPQFFGKAFQGLSSTRNLVHHHHQPQASDETVKYIHHSHGAPTKGGGFMKGGGGDDDLIKTMLLLSPGGLRTILLSKVLSSFKGGKSSKGGSDNQLMDLLLLNSLTSNNNVPVVTPAPNPNPTPTPNVVLDGNRLLRLGTQQPVTLIDSNTGQVVLADNIQVLTSGALVNSATRRPVGFIDPATNVLVPAVVPVAATTNRAGVVNRAGTAGFLSPLTASPLRNGINLIFLSPLTPSAVPPPTTGAGSSTYIQGALRQLLGDDLARFLGNQPITTSRGQGITSAAGRTGQTCTVIRNGQTVPFQLQPQDGRRLTPSECVAMGKLLDKFVPTFLQNFVPSDVAAAGLGRRRTNTNSNARSGQNNNNNNFGNVPQQLPALTPNLDGLNFGGTSSSRLGSQGSSTTAQWNSLNDHITVQNDSNGCIIAVPHISPQC